MNKEVSNYVVINEDSHEYNMVVTKSKNKTKYELFYSENADWYDHVKGTLAFKITDSGNNFILPKKIRKIGYDVSLYLRLIFTFENRTSSNPAEHSEWRIVNVDNQIKI